MPYGKRTNHDTSLVYVEHAIIIGYPVHAVVVLAYYRRSVLESHYVYAGVLHIIRFLEQPLIVRHVALELESSAVVVVVVVVLSRFA